MEDTLGATATTDEDESTGLNPCSNGRYSRRININFIDIEIWES